MNQIISMEKQNFNEIMSFNLKEEQIKKDINTIQEQVNKMKT